MNDVVVLIHGIARSSAHMKKLQHFLQGEGYEVINIDYPSTKHPLAALVDNLHDQLVLRIAYNERVIHFVGYSMGALIVRGLLTKYRPSLLGRVVLLAPPNQGSEVADYLQQNWIYKFFYGPAGGELITNQSAISTLHGNIDYPLGIIAGDRFIDPICALLLPGAHDGKVTVERTKIAGMTDHITLHATHSFFPTNKQVLKQTAYFLKQGHFYHG